MDYKDMKKSADARSPFVKLEKDTSTKVQFLSDDYKEVVSQFKQQDGSMKKVYRYELPCLVEGQKKKYQGSFKFYEKCMTKATNRGKGLADLVYVITRMGEGINTEYDIDVADEASNASVGEASQRVDSDGVPF